MTRPSRRPRASGPATELAPWTLGDLDLLRRLVGDPAMMEHLGGAETDERIADRHRRYLEPDSGSYKIIEAASGADAGWVGLWSREWRGEEVYEVGWSVLPAFQGRGLARSAAAAVIALAAADARHGAVHAFPAPENGSSNAICSRLGFDLLGEVDIEYPPGNPTRCNDWRLELRPGRLTRRSGSPRKSGGS